MTCIWQTITLWLGDMSGHNFFASNTVSYESSVLYPKAIWASVNRNIYQIDGSNDIHSMKFRLLYELFNELRKDSVLGLGTPKVSLEELLTTASGIIYEFGTSLTLDEIIGQPVKTTNNKYTSSKIKTIYVDMSESNGNRIYVYLINEKLKVTQKLSIHKTLTIHSSAIKYYKEAEDDIELKTYQASILSPNDSEFLKGNIFYPINNQGIPIHYSKIKLLPLVEDANDEKLMEYVNALLKNPNNQTRIDSDQGITFTDNLSLSVQYNTAGTLEFKKTLNSEVEKTTSIEKLGTAISFIRTSQAIPQELKKGLYLKEITEDTSLGETSYLFGYQYDNFNIYLSDDIKETLQINDFVELVVKNNEITRGKWILVRPEADEVTNSNFYELTKEANEAINDIMEQVGVTVREGFTLENLECIYYIEDLSKSTGLEWMGTYEIHIKKPEDEETGSEVDGEVDHEITTQSALSGKFKR